MTDTGGYRDSAAPEIIGELREQIAQLVGENAALRERLGYAGLDLPTADKLPVWVAPYLNWWDSRKGSRCPGCGAQSPSYPRVHVHGCNFVSGDHVHVKCSNCHETACWQEKR